MGFGLTYLLIRGGGLLLLVLLFMLVGAAVAGSGQGGAAGTSLIGLVITLFVAWLAFCVSASVLAMKGKIAGAIMGMVDAGILSLLLLLDLVSSFGSSMPGTGIRIGIGVGGLVLNGVIILMAILALRTNAAAKRAPMAHPEPGMPMHTPVPRPMVRAPLPGAPAPLMPAPLPIAPAPLPVAAAAPTPEFPHASLLQLLAVAASVEPEHAPARIQRAAAAAAKLLGPNSHYEVNQWLSAPVPVNDLGAQIAALAPFVKSNPRMAQGVLKCAQYALKDAQGAFTPGAQAAIETLESALA